MDLLHPGHLSMLEEVKGMCDHLIVGLHTNPQLDRPEKNKPIETIFERYYRLKACKFVDEVIPYDTEADLINLLCVIKPDIRFLSEEYIDKPFTGKDLPIKCVFNSRKHSFSSSSLRKRL